MSIRKKKLFSGLFLLLLVTIIVIYITNRMVVQSANGKLFSQTDSVPFHKVGLLLGTTKYVKSGRVNPYYANRIVAAADLLKKSRIKYLVIIGDNSRETYNEPEMMRQDLIRAGIDSSVIFLDYAGFRTFDSVIRLKEIFGQDTVTIISQQFHVERAIYIASKLHITAIGFNATDVPAAWAWKVQIREKLARVKVVLDFIFGTKPKFLGEKVTLPA